MRWIGVLLLALLVCSYVVDARTDLDRRKRRRRAKPTAAEVFLGYMDEESYFTLSTLLAKQAADKPYSQVLLIERCKRGFPHDTASLLQRPVADDNIFKGAATMQLWTPADDGTLSLNARFTAPSELSTALATALTTGVNKNANLATQLGNVWASWIKTKTDPTKPSVCLYQWGYNEAKAAEKAAIVIRTPEMGLNPSAVRPYVLSELAAIKVAGITNINLWAIGASGAANSKDCAGCMQSLSASWFAGFEVEDKKIIPEIAYDSIADAAPKFLAQAAKLDAPQGKEKFSDKDPDGKLKANSQTLWEALGVTPAPPAVAKHKTTAGVTEDKKNIAMTLSYFGGEKTKAASSAMFGHSTNTEDYHVIRIMEDVANNKCNPASTVVEGSCPTMGEKRVFRVDCDPFSVSQAEVKLMNEDFLHAKDHAFVTIEQHAKVILWGLKGMLMSEINSKDHAMCWKYAAAQIAAGKIKLSQFIPAWKSGADACVLNPAFLEIATDFYNDASDTNPDKAKYWPQAGRAAGQTAIKALSSASTQEQVEKVLIDHVAKALWANFYDITGKLTAGSEAKLKYWDGDGKKPTDGVPTKETVATFTYTKATLMPVWSRDGWGTYQDPAFTGISNAEIGCVGLWNLNSEGTDRMYYKASNFPGLRDLNKKLLDGGVATFAGDGKLADTCVCG